MRDEDIKDAYKQGIENHKAFTTPTWNLAGLWDEGPDEKPSPDFGLTIRDDFRRLCTRELVLAHSGAPKTDAYSRKTFLRPVSAFRPGNYVEEAEVGFHHTMGHEAIHARELSLCIAGLVFILPILAIGAGIIAKYQTKDYSWVAIGLVVAAVVKFADERWFNDFEEAVAEIGASVIANRLHLIDGVRVYSIDYVAHNLKRFPACMRMAIFHVAWFEAMLRVRKCSPVPDPAYIGSATPLRRHHRSRRDGLPPTNIAPHIAIRGTPDWPQ